MTFTSDARKNKYQSFNNLGNEAEISLYFDLIFRTYALPKLKAAYSNITSLRFFVQKNKTLIKARWSEGFRLDDFKHVIDTTVKDWSGTKYEKYLRPETLFGSKFEGYLNQAPRTKKEIIDERLGF